MKISKAVNKAAAICLALLFCVMLSAAAASAYEAKTNARIPVSCLKVSDESDQIYTIKIETESSQAPAPRSDILSISEDGTAYFEIDITEPGTFDYTVYELRGDDEAIEYDSSVYNVTLFVENGPDGELIYNVIAGKAGEDTKHDSIDFYNKRRSAGVVDEPKTDDPPKEQPDDHTGNPITGFIGSILTGNTIPAHAVRSVMLIFVLSLISSFLFRRGSREEEENK
ncbi:MAG: hypothetical protein IJ555_01760 [Ruminococcus sp.]|nr:hypothetical protein [Ruminococcus sp.]